MKKIFLISLLFISGCVYTGTIGSTKDNNQPLKKTDIDKVINSEPNKNDINYAQKKGWHLPIEDVDKDKCAADSTHPYSTGLPCQEK